MENKKGDHKDNVAKVMVNGTERKALVTIVSLNPEIALSPDGSDRITAESSSAVSVAESERKGTDKKGMVYFKPFVVES